MWNITINDLRLFFSDRKAVLLTLLIPIALSTLFAFAFGGVGAKRTADSPTKLIIADEDKTAFSKTIITKLDSLQAFEVLQTSSDSARSLVKLGKCAAVLVLHKGLTDSINAKNPFIEFLYDAARPSEVGVLQGALIGNLIDIIGTEAMLTKTIQEFDKTNPKVSNDKRKLIHKQIIHSFETTKSLSKNVEIIKSTPVIVSKTNSPGLIQAVAGTTIMMLLFSLTAIGASMLTEKSSGTLKRLLFSPIHPNRILYAKMLSCNIISVFQLGILFLFSGLVLGLEIIPHLLSLVLMIIATAFACSGFGVILASVAKTRHQLDSYSTLIILVMSCVGGSMIPIFFMPVFMQKMAQFSVNYWAIQGFYDIFWRNLPLTDSHFLTRIAVLVGIGTGLNLLAHYFFRKNILDLE